MKNFKLISKKLEYKGKIIDVYSQTMELPDGRIVPRDLVHLRDAVAILAITPNNKVILVRQYRDGSNSTLEEIPAGLIDEGEDPITAAKRELLEETGYKASKFTKLCEFYASPGSLTSKTTIFLAENAIKIDSQHLDSCEFVEFYEIDTNRFKNTNYLDGKTLIATKYV